MRRLLKHHITSTVTLHKNKKSHSQEQALVIDHDDFASAPPPYLACFSWRMGPTSSTRLRHRPHVQSRSLELGDWVWR